MKSIATLVIAFLASATLHAQIDRTITITSGGRTRTFDLHLPASPPPVPLPVVFVFNGTGGTRSGMRSVTGFDEMSNTDNFIVVYPQAVLIGADIQWNVYVDDQPGHAGVGDNSAPDDVQFTRDILTYLQANFPIEPTRIFATGLSNGGFMDYALSMFGSDFIHAIAPVAGNLWGNDVFLQSYLASGVPIPMPVMHVHGTADNTVDYPDPDNAPADYGEYPLFVAARGCGALTYTSVVPIATNVDKLMFCPPPMEVSLLRITGMGHAWSNGTFSTSHEILRFFGLEGTTGVNNSDVPATAVIPNPATDHVRTVIANNAYVSIISAFGERVYSRQHLAGAVDIFTRQFPAGVYELVIASDNQSRPTRSQTIVIVH
jgi:poly(3-hydroxybutyrate) depolymerase